MAVLTVKGLTVVLSWNYYCEAVAQPSFICVAIQVASATRQIDKEGWNLCATISYLIENFLPSLLQNFDDCEQQMKAAVSKMAYHSLI